MPKQFLGIFEGKNSGFSLDQKAVGQSGFGSFPTWFFKPLFVITLFF
jgi:hypothetical protein